MTHLDPIAALALAVALADLAVAVALADLAVAITLHIDARKESQAEAEHTARKRTALAAQIADLETTRPRHRWISERLAEILRDIATDLHARADEIDPQTDEDSGDLNL